MAHFKAIGAAFSLIFFFLPQAVGQTIVVDQNNVYSPEMRFINGDLKMFYGGWKDNGQVHDAIYRADCPIIGAACSLEDKVIDPNDYSYVHHLNDPSIVFRPSEGDPGSGYFIMYMTGLRSDYLDDGQLTVDDHSIYYATSWANDGLNWSDPVELIQGRWLPSATVRNDEVYLYYNGDVANFGIVTRQKLGPSGVTLNGDPQWSTVWDGDNLAWNGYANVDVTYEPESDNFQILAETTSRIDYLSSDDGISWNLERDGVIVPTGEQLKVRTPTPHPNNYNQVYYGATTNPVNNASMANDIYFCLVPDPGDFDVDGDVDSDDLTQWQGDLAVNGNSDADGDGDSDGFDFLAWQRHFGSGTISLASSRAVPEPSTLALLFASALFLTTATHIVRPTP